MVSYRCPVCGNTYESPASVEVTGIACDGGGKHKPKAMVPEPDQEVDS